MDQGELNSKGMFATFDFCFKFISKHTRYLTALMIHGSFQVACMMTRRLGVAVAVLNGYLYAIGGSDGQCPLNTVERYDPRKNQWAPMAPMSTRRKHLGCAVFNNMIYAGNYQL